jgi:hypothetical protein
VLGEVGNYALSVLGPVPPLNVALAVFCWLPGVQAAECEQTLAATKAALCPAFRAVALAGSMRPSAHL